MCVIREVRPFMEERTRATGISIELQHHVDLNDPRLVMNTQHFEEDHSDYLAMLSPPDFEHLSSPHEYVKDEIHVRASPNPTNTPGYMCMKSSSIFNPRLAEDPVCSLDIDSDSNHKNSNDVVYKERLRVRNGQCYGFPLPLLQPDLPLFTQHQREDQR